MIEPFTPTVPGDLEAALATFVPARHASRTDPSSLLRAE